MNIKINKKGRVRAVVQNKRHGFSLMETVVALAIFALITTSLYSLFSIGIKVVNEDKSRIGARVIAEEKMEIIRNLSYDNVGTLGGIPAGDIVSSEIVVLNNINYSVAIDIHYVDDAYDGLAPTDVVNVDYKKVRVQVSWTTKLDSEPIILVSDIVPRDIESLEEGGTLYLEVFDSSPSPVSGATIQIINNEVTPVVNISSSTNAEGIYILPGAALSTQNYQVLISNSGYSTAQTYSVDPVANPNPSPAHLSIGDGEVTNKLFIIDLLSDLNLTVQLENGDPVESFSFALYGDDAIGTDSEGMDIYEYEQTHTTIADGTVALSGLDPDIYNIEFDELATGYDLAGYTSDLPYNLAADEIGSLTLFLAPHANDTLLTTVTDAGGTKQENASVRLYDSLLTYDITQDTNVYGQTFFTPLSSGLYNMEVTKAGFEIFNIEVNIDEQSTQNVSLSTP